MPIQAGLERIHTLEQLLQGQSHHIRQRGMVQVRRIAQVVRVGASDNLAGYADHHRVGRDGFDHHGVGADAAVIADGNRTKHFGACADHDPVPDGGMPFAFLQAGPAQGHAMVERDIRANLGGLANDHAHAMINEKAGADGCAGMDLDAGQVTGNL